MTKCEKKITVANKKGMHARPAALFVQLAERFQSNVTVIKEGEKVNGKSIMGLLMLGAGAGVVLTIVTEGPDAQEALKAIEEFLGKPEEELGI